MKLAVDVGGTFTDVVYFDPHTRQTRIVKCLSTPHAFEQGVFSAVAEALQGVETAGTDFGVSFVHGSTIVINHLIERKGAKTALLTTLGFRDNLDIQRTNRPDLYNVRYRKPEPFVPRCHRYEVTERIGPDGTILTPLNADKLDELVDELRREQFQAVAIAFINAYQNPVHELALRNYLEPELPGVYISCSSVVRLWREYERTNTVVANAYVRPTVASYVGRLDEGLVQHGMGTLAAMPPTMMLSNGGRATFQAASEWPIDLVESGPAAGVTGARVMAARIGIDKFIALDVGGTTAKAALVENGEPLRLQEYVLEPGRQGGYPLLVPTIDIVEVGAGGGSVVRLTEDGGLRIGPDSVGAMPGPACYGQGGTEPSITDACYLSGRLPDVLASGLRLDRAAAEKALAHLVVQLGVSVDELIAGVLRLAASRMATVVQLATVARGKDPREYHLFAYGGSAPLYAVEVARELRIPTVVIPLDAGVFASWGMVYAPYQIDVMKTVRVAWPSGRSELETECDILQQDAGTRMRHMGRISWSTQTFVDIQFAGQARSLPIHLASLETLAKDFIAAHQEKYGFVLDAPLEVTGVHLIALDDSDQVEGSNCVDLDSTTSNRTRTPLRPREIRAVLTAVGWCDAAVYTRDALIPGDCLTGPVVIEEPTTTTYVPTGATLTVDAQRNLIIAAGEEG